MNARKFSGTWSSRLALLGVHRFGLLFGSLLLTIGGSAFLADFGLDGALNVLILLDLVVLLAVVSGRGALRAALGLVAVSIFSWVLSALTVERAFLPVGQLSAIILFVLGTLGCFKAAFSPGPVDRERLAAALNFYLLLGLIFAFLFTVIAELRPGSFHFAIARPAEFAARPLADMVYYSFVTLATLGYGDIVPLSSSAKGLAILEAIVGQIYLVVVVARLVSLYGKSESR
jgi:voltage-gated potassium channel